jgi:hypothetical protein
MNSLGRGSVVSAGQPWSPSGDAMRGLVLTPSVIMDPDLRAVHELLELLDDAMFAAIEGDEASGRRARELWRQATTSLRGELLEESREHYLRFAAEAMRQPGPEGVRDPRQMLAASEVIELLTT